MKVEPDVWGGGSWEDRARCLEGVIHRMGMAAHDKDEQIAELNTLVQRLSGALGEARQRIEELEADVARLGDNIGELVGDLAEAERDLRMAELEAELEDGLPYDKCECPDCHGRGTIIWHEAAEDGTGDGDEVQCPECKGTGREE